MIAGAGLQQVDFCIVETQACQGNQTGQVCTPLGEGQPMMEIVTSEEEGPSPGESPRQGTGQGGESPGEGTGAQILVARNARHPGTRPGQPYIPDEVCVPYPPRPAGTPSRRRMR